MRAVSSFWTFGLTVFSLSFLNPNSKFTLIYTVWSRYFDQYKWDNITILLNFKHQYKHQCVHSNGTRKKDNVISLEFCLKSNFEAHMQVVLSFHTSTSEFGASHSRPNCFFLLFSVWISYKYTVVVGLNNHTWVSYLVLHNKLIKLQGGQPK